MAPTYAGDFHLRGKDLRAQGLNRVGNMLVPNSNYCAFEDWIMPILDAMLLEQKQGTLWTPSKVQQLVSDCMLTKPWILLLLSNQPPSAGWRVAWFACLCKRELLTLRVHIFAAWPSLSAQSEQQLSLPQMVDSSHTQSLRVQQAASLRPSVQTVKSVPCTKAVCRVIVVPNIMVHVPTDLLMQMIHRLGKEIDHPDSIYYWAYKHNIPVYCPALTDGSLGDMLYFHTFKNPGLVLDIIADIRSMNDEAMKAPPRKTGVIILGGGTLLHHQQLKWALHSDFFCLHNFAVQTRVFRCVSAVLLAGPVPNLLRASANHYRPLCGCCSIHCFLRLHVDIAGDSKAPRVCGGGGRRGLCGSSCAVSMRV